MSTSSEILQTIRQNLRREALSPTKKAALYERLRLHARHTVPGPFPDHPAALQSLFAAKIRASAATTDTVGQSSHILPALTKYLLANNLPLHIEGAQNPWITTLNWQDFPDLSFKVSRYPVQYKPPSSETETDVFSPFPSGDKEARDSENTDNFAENSRPQNSPAVILQVAAAGIAETGSLMLLSSPLSPHRFNFLPLTEIFLLSAGSLVKNDEDAFDRLRRHFTMTKQSSATDTQASASAKTDPEADRHFLPRVISLITGPSRTADIEQTLEIGMHGPHKIHVILVEQV